MVDNASHQPQGASPRLFTRKTLVCALYGFSSGLPFYVLVSLLPAWLRKEGVALAQISALTWVRAPYTWKFAWAPLVDRISFGFLSRRRDWALGTQLLLAVATAGFGQLSPVDGIWPIAVLGLLVAVFGATQDIAIDAYRRELLSDLELGFGNSVAVNAYRLAGLVPGGLALLLADHAPWSVVFLMVSAFMFVGVVGTWLAPVVESEASPSSLIQAIAGPFREFFSRGDLKQTFGTLAFLFLYKLGDNLATTLATPFYLDMGFTLTEIGSLVKVVSLWSMVVGSLLGGWVMSRIGINRALWLFGAFQMLSILGFALLAETGRNLAVLGLVVLLEYLGIGLGTAAFVAFIAKATNQRYSATQYALFSSFVALPGILCGSVAGLLVEHLGYTQFFLLCTALAVPGLLLLPRVAPWQQTEGS
jgi:MFS transporter, PAT family, beta-lactamase induction signal transducer AmpG